MGDDAIGTAGHVQQQPGFVIVITEAPDLGTHERSPVVIDSKSYKRTPAEKGE
jgi:hypothetical protein